jgi:ADP-ribosylglycohydrolase
LQHGARLAEGRSSAVDAIMQAVLHRRGLLHHDAPMGYVLLTLERALVALRDASSFEAGVLTVIRMGGDTDTNACVAGAALGARFGLDGIPARWRDGLAGPERLAAALAALPG